MNEYEFPDERLANVQDQLDKLVEKNYYLNKAAFEAYKSYLHSYQSHSLKDVYDVNNLDLQKVARSFGFKIPPRVSLNIKLTERSQRKKKVVDFLRKNNSVNKTLLNRKRNDGDNR